MSKRVRDEEVASSDHANGDGLKPVSATDENDFSGFSDNESEEDRETQDQDGNNVKRQKAQVSAKDVQVARETAELFKSNIFKLQIDELISELKLKDSHISLVEKALHKLHDLLQQIPDTNNMTLDEAEQLITKSKIAIPFPDPKPTKVNYKFAFKAPEQVSLVGSFGLKTGIHNPEGMSIDMSLTMPKELFQPKDYLNYRALYKRAFYLSHICLHLTQLAKKNNFPIKLSYEYMNDDILCPVIRIESVNTKNEGDLIFTKTKMAIKILVAFPFRIFESKKLIPDKNCIRIAENDNQLPPTPLYNSSILSSTAYDYYLKYLYSTKKSSEAFRDACALGKLWLTQRGFDSSFQNGGFGHFEFAILMSALLQGGGLNGNKILLHGFSSYQLFKGTIKYIATQDLLEKGYLSFSSLIGEVNSIYKETNPNFLTVFDKNTKINILWKMTRSSYEILQKMAHETLLLLNDVVRDRFDPIFLQNLKFDDLNYDIVMKLPLKQFTNTKEFGALEKISFLTFEHYIKTKLYKILKEALGDRVKQISIKLSRQPRTFSVTKRKPSSNSEESEVIIGIFLNPLECEKLVTKGPDNESEEEGLLFRQFWGPKASLRRFKDGSIQHSVIWQTSAIHPVCLQIIGYILKKHFLQDEADLKISSSNIEKFQSLLPSTLLPAAGKQSIISTQPNQTLKASFENLSKAISAIDLPLTVRTISPISAAMRYCSVLQPVPFAVANPDYFNELILQFETSTNWPDELTAVEKTKVAFILKIQESLAKQTNYKTMLRKDKTIPFVDCIVLLDILTPEGYGFTIRILTERDELLFLRAIENAPDKHKSLVKDAYLKFNQKYISSIKHHRTITVLAHHFPLYSPTVRLFKKWLDSQLLLSHFREELIELLVIKVFVDPAPYSVPVSVEVAFLRVLSFLSSWNWKESPLILDLTKTDEVENDELLTKLSDRLSVQTYQLINSNFEALRKQDPNGTKLQFFVGSKEDNSGIIWSSNLSLPISTRLTALARVAMSLLTENGITTENIDLLFKPALQDFDFVLHLKLPFKLDSASGVLPPNAFKNLVNLDSYPEDFKLDPILRFVSELTKRFGNVIIFSSHKYTGLCKNGDENVITGLLMPTAMSPRKFKVDQGFNFQPCSDGNQVEINKSAIIAQIYALGGDLIKSASWS